MVRRGRCRCGTLLKFRPGPQGYKMRCPGCGSVVRLRVDVAPPAGAPADPALVRTEKLESLRPVFLPGAGPPLPVILPAETPIAALNGPLTPEKLLAVSALPPDSVVPGAPAGGPNTLHCEVCCTVIPADARRCPACDSEFELPLVEPPDEPAPLVLPAEALVEPAPRSGNGMLLLVAGLAGGITLLAVAVLVAVVLLKS